MVSYNVGTVCSFIWYQESKGQTAQPKRQRVGEQNGKPNGDSPRALGLYRYSGCSELKVISRGTRRHATETWTDVPGPPKSWACCSPFRHCGSFNYQLIP